MTRKKQQTHAKRAREFALMERRERKRAKKAERATPTEAAPANGDDGDMFPTEMPQDERAGVAPVEDR